MEDIVAGIKEYVIKTIQSRGILEILNEFKDIGEDGKTYKR